MPDEKKRIAKLKIHDITATILAADIPHKLKAADDKTKSCDDKG